MCLFVKHCTNSFSFGYVQNTIKRVPTLWFDLLHFVEVTIRIIYYDSFPLNNNVNVTKYDTIPPHNVLLLLLLLSLMLCALDYYIHL